MRLNIDINGEGPHTIVSPQHGKKFLVASAYLTFAHPHAVAQPIVFMSADRDLLGPFLMLDGGVIDYTRDPYATFDVRQGEPFRIRLADGVRCSGVIEYDIGAW